MSIPNIKNGFCTKCGNAKEYKKGKLCLDCYNADKANKSSTKQEKYTQVEKTAYLAGQINAAVKKGGDSKIKQSYDKGQQSVNNPKPKKEPKADIPLFPK